jgi:hypothetical protein
MQFIVDENTPYRMMLDTGILCAREAVRKINDPAAEQLLEALSMHIQAKRSAAAMTAVFREKMKERAENAKSDALMDALGKDSDNA